MKKVFCILVCLIFLCGCEKNKNVMAVPLENSTISIEYQDKNYKYYYKSDSNCIYIIPCTDTIPIEFAVINNKIACKFNNVTCNYEEFLRSSPINIMLEVINNSIGKTVSPDYNGRYLLHGVTEFGEYELYFDNNGTPKKLISKNYDLSVSFS